MSNVHTPCNLTKSIVCAEAFLCSARVCNGHALLQPGDSGIVYMYACHCVLYLLESKQENVFTVLADRKLQNACMYF